MHIDKKVIKIVLIYFIIIFSFMSIGNMFRCVFDHSNRLTNISYLVVFTACLTGIAINKRVTRLSVIVFLIEVMYFLLYFIIKIRGRYIVGTAKSVVLVFLLMSVYFINLIYRNEEQIFFNAFSNIVCMVAAVSLFFWIFGSILNVLPGRTQVTYEWATMRRTCYTFRYIYYEIPVQSRLLPNGFRLFRNTAIFPESPGSASFFAYGIMNELFFKNKKNNRRITLLLFALLSTFSTKGILILIEVAVYGIWVRFMKDKHSLFSGLLLILSPILLLCFGSFAYLIVVQKAGTYSYMLRADDLYSTLKVWRNNPIFGTGYSTDEIIENFTLGRNNNGLSMGIAVQLAKGGLYMIMIYFIPMLMLLINKKYIKDFVDRLVIVIILVTEFYISNVATSMVFIMIMCIVIGIVIDFDRVPRIGESGIMCCDT